MMQIQIPLLAHLFNTIIGTGFGVIKLDQVFVAQINILLLTARSSNYDQLMFCQKHIAPKRQNEMFVKI